MDREVLEPPDAVADRPYASGVRTGDTVYLSGQPGRDPRTGQQPAGIEAQTRQAMDNLRDVLATAGLDHRHLVKCHVHLARMTDYAGMNAAYGAVFDERVPARTTVEVAGLPDDAGVQVACMAHRDLSRISVVSPAEGSLPRPLGPYSAAVWAGDMLYLSGMGGQFPEERRLPEPLGEQVTQTLVNIGTTLDAAGLTFADVVSSHMYVTTPGEIAELAPAYDRAFEGLAAPPTGTTFLPRLPGGIKAELTFVAWRAGASQPVRSGNTADGTTRGLRAGETLFTRTASAPDAGEGFDEQLRAVLRRLQQTLRDAELGWAHVAHVQVGLADLDDLPDLDRIFREFFPDAPPARTTIGVNAEHGARVQVSLVAAR